MNKSSDYHRQKVYYKFQEVMADIDLAKRRREQGRLKILSDKCLLDFAYGRIRFEATTGHRALETLGIPTKLNEFLKFHDWYERLYKEPLSRYLWRTAFKKIFSQIEGHTMKNVDDNEIRLKIDKQFIRIKDNGKICKRRANAVFNTYRQIKMEGYDQLAKEHNSTFFRNVKSLNEIGLSRAFLKSLDPQRPNENVVPLIQLIKIDFSKQRPDWYQEPVSGFTNPLRHLKSVA
jgi:II/X family phage/plasmid replication protein